MTNTQLILSMLAEASTKDISAAVNLFKNDKPPDKSGP